MDLGKGSRGSAPRDAKIGMDYGQDPLAAHELKVTSMLSMVGGAAMDETPVSKKK